MAISLTGKRIADSLGETYRAIASLTNVVNLISTPMIRSEELQKKSLALGTNMAKFLEANTESMKGLRGDFFENAEVILGNVAAGLRTNSKGLSLLQNRMKQTGQDAGLARQMALNIAMATGFNTEATDRLTRGNIELARTYSTTNEALLQAVNSMKKEIDLASFLDSSEQIASLTQELAARFPGQMDKVTAGLRMLISPDAITQRYVLRIGGTADALLDATLSSGERADLAIRAINTATQNLESLVKTSKGGTNQLFRLSEIIKGVGNEAGLVALKQLSDGMSQAKDFKDTMKSATDEYADSYTTMMKEWKSSFAEPASEYYSKSLNHLGSIQTMMGGLAGIQVAGALGGLGGRGAGAGVGRLVGSFGRLLGPIGLIAGLFLPEIIDLMSGDKGVEKDAKKEQLNVLTQIKENTNKMAGRKDPDKYEGRSLEAFVVNELSRSMAGFANQKPDKSNEMIVEELRRVRELLEKGNKSAARSSFGPSLGGR